MGDTSAAAAEPMSVRLAPEAFAKPPGGVRRAAMDLLAALRATKIDVSVSSLAERSVTTTSPAPSALTRAAMQALEAGYLLTRRLRNARGVIHSLYYDPLLRAGGWPLVVTVHDMIHERLGEGSSRLRWAKRLAVTRASLIITPSRASAADVARIFPQLRAQIITIPWGIAPHFLAEERGRQSPIASPFLLYVGARSGYKNFSILVRALASSRALDEFRLVMVGGEPLRDPERSTLIEALGARDRLVHLQAPADDVLRSLYDDAHALVVTSRCEGFGLPLLEALARGCPVACADAAASVEVAAGHAAIFPSDSADGCTHAILEAVGVSPEQRLAGKTHAQRFDWATTAAAHVSAYCSVASSS